MKKLYIIGLGPGAGLDLTGRAEKALDDCEVLVGYTAYIDLLREQYPDRQLIATPMRTEVERCRLALGLAQEGKKTGMVCSGDPGIYGMAGLCMELSGEYPEVELEVVPGVTAANGGAALLGAPLMNDFAVISLSDLMTPWETITRRLKAAAEADFVLCLYNPSSRKRRDHLRRACEILLEVLPPETPCGCARNIGREGEETRLYTLSELREAETDMFTTVYVGNSRTKVMNGRLVTPRGYLQKEPQA